MPKWKSLREETREEAINLYRQGLSIRQVRERLERPVTRRAIARWVEEAGQQERVKLEAALGQLDYLSEQLDALRGEFALIRWELLGPDHLSSEIQGAEAVDLRAG